MRLSAPKPLLGKFGALLERHDIAPVLMDLSGPTWIIEALKPMSDDVAAEFEAMGVRVLRKDPAQR